LQICGEADDDVEEEGGEPGDDGGDEAGDGAVCSASCDARPIVCADEAVLEAMTHASDASVASVRNQQCGLCVCMCIWRYELFEAKLRTIKSAQTVHANTPQPQW
jgi:hypothetical protein